MSLKENPEKIIAVFRAVTQRIVVIFLPTFRDDQSGPGGCPETSIRNHNYSPSNNPEELRSRLLRGGILKSRKLEIKTLSLDGDTKCILKNADICK